MPWSFPSASWGLMQGPAKEKGKFQIRVLWENEWKVKQHPGGQVRTPGLDGPKQNQNSGEGCGIGRGLLSEALHRVRDTEIKDQVIFEEILVIVLIYIWPLLARALRSGTGLRTGPTSLGSSFLPAPATDQTQIFINAGNNILKYYSFVLRLFPLKECKCPQAALLH